MSNMNHEEMINMAIKLIEQDPADLMYGNTARNFTLSALKSILSVDGNNSLTRKNAGKYISNEWIFYESAKVGYCKLSCKTLRLKAFVINEINERDGIVKQNMFDLFNVIIAQLDKDATIDYASNKWTKNVLVDRISAIEALKISLNPPLRLSGASGID